MSDKANSAKDNPQDVGFRSDARGWGAYRGYPGSTSRSSGSPRAAVVGAVVFVILLLIVFLVMGAMRGDKQAAQTQAPAEQEPATWQPQQVE